jgi:hypothetical protein
MPEKKAFQCDRCKRETLATDDGGTPACCGKPMQSIPMDQCTLSTTAEHSRFDQDDEPCDDGRAG